MLQPEWITPVWWGLGSSRLGNTGGLGEIPGEGGLRAGGGALSPPHTHPVQLLSLGIPEFHPS